MQRIEVDEEAQATWAAHVQRFHSEAQLQVVDQAGQWHSLVEVNKDGIRCQTFDGQAAKFRLSGANGSG